MPAQWTSELIGKMHANRIKQADLARFLMVTPEYVSAIMNGKRTPAGAEQKFRAALNALIAEKQQQ